MFWFLDSDFFLVVSLIFKTEKSEENFLSEEMDILTSPLNKTWTPNTSKETSRGNSPEGKLKMFDYYDGKCALIVIFL